jgi:hypothetical protein
VIGDTGDPDAHPFEQLGYNSPKPNFGVARKVGVITPLQATDLQNIVALPGGVQNVLNLADNGKMGAALYLFDPDIKYHASPDDSANYTAGGVKVFNSGSYTHGGVPSKWKVGTSYTGAAYSEPYMGMMTSEPTFITKTSGNSYISDGVFACDNRGNIHYVSFLNESLDEPSPIDMSGWSIRTVGTLRKGSDAPTDSYSNPYGVLLGWRADRANEMWICGGTANAGGIGEDQVQNKEQMIFSFLMPSLADDSPGLSSRAGDINGGSGWTELLPDEGDSGIQRDLGNDGWYIKLAPADAEYGAEYASVKPIMFGGNVYAATFREQLLTTSGGLCDTGTVIGESRLYAMGMDTGIAAQWSDDSKKYLTFNGIKITGFTLSSTGSVDTIIFTYSVLDAVTAENSINTNLNAEKNNGLSKVEGDVNAVQIRLYNSSTVKSPLTSNDTLINYWRFSE